MKRFLLIIVAILASLPAFSQINLKDSTVQVVAYWQKGEKYFYDTKSYELHIHNGDTSVVYEFNERFSIEVVDSTANSYKIKCKLENRPHLKSLSADEDTVLQLVYNVMEKYLDRINVPVVFITDEFGTIQNIEGIDVLQKEMYNIVSDMLKDVETEFNNKLLKDVPQEERKQIMGVVEELFNNAVLKQYENEQGIFNNFKEIVSLLTFHGSKLNLNKEYRSTSRELLPLYEGSEVDVNEIFYVYEYNPETSWVNIDYIKKYDPEQMHDLAFNMIQRLKIVPEGTKIKKEDVPEFTIDCYTGLEVHTNSGWPGYVYSEKRTNNGGKIKVEVFTVDIDL